MTGNEEKGSRRMSCVGVGEMRQGEAMENKMSESKERVSRRS